MPEPWQSILAAVRRRCRPAGLDLVQPFRVALYNRAVDDIHRLPDLGRADALGLLIGNTRALWPHFVAALRADPGRAEAERPLDELVVEQVTRALRPLGALWEARFAHEAPPRRVAMQRLAEVSGLAWVSPANLCIHPTHGPWIGLRAAVTVDVPAPPPPSGIPPACDACERACLPEMRRALAADAAASAGAEADPGTWRLWLAVRDACPVGREHRYGEDQIAYHYAKDRGLLRRLARPG